jgi:DNA-directed RNA polymerase subunit M/transcription elongation factor TFIIS
VCKNMLYIEVEDAEGIPSLKHYCKNCKYSRTSGRGEKSISDKSKLNTSDIAYKSYMTPFIKYDPTLPRVNNVKCTNTECKASKNEVIYIKYDGDNLKFLYHCCHCGHFWKLD